MRLAIVDIETTGLSPAEGAEVIEIAWVSLVDDGPDPMTRGSGPFAFENHETMLCKPEREIPYYTSAVHHLITEDFAHAGSAQDALAMFDEVKGVRVAHHSAYEASFLGGLPWLCTFKAAKRLWPDLKSHSNHAIRYRLGLIDIPEWGLGREQLNRAHRALPDALVTAAIVNQLLDVATVEDMLAWTLQPVYMPTCPLKKHKGQPWADVPTSYLEWIVKQPDMDADILHWSRAELSRR